MVRRRRDQVRRLGEPGARFLPGRTHVPDRRARTMGERIVGEAGDGELRWMARGRTFRERRDDGRRMGRRRGHDRDSELPGRRRRGLRRRLGREHHHLRRRRRGLGGDQRSRRRRGRRRGGGDTWQRLRGRRREGGRRRRGASPGRRRGRPARRWRPRAAPRQASARRRPARRPAPALRPGDGSRRDRGRTPRPPTPTSTSALTISVTGAGPAAAHRLARVEGEAVGRRRVGAAVVIIGHRTTPAVSGPPRIALCAPASLQEVAGGGL